MANKLVMVRVVSNYILIDKPLAEAMSIYSALVPVNKNGYNKDSKVEELVDAIDFELFDEKYLVRLSNVEESNELLRGKLKAAEDEKSKQWMKAYNLEKEVEKLKAELEVLLNACPKTPDKEEEVKEHD